MGTAEGAGFRVPFRSAPDAPLDLFAAPGAWDGERVAAARVCGGCREFVEDGELGRGTCLHPGSGVLHPWADTPGCDFWSGGGQGRRFPGR